MNKAEQRAILTLCLMAAFADGGNSERERAEIKRIADTLGADGALDASAIYQEVLLRKPDLAAVAATLTQQDQRQFAYEMAVCVCDADGATSPAEREFLGRLAQALGLDAGAAQAFTRQADAVTGAPLEGSALDGGIVAAVPANAAELDKMILNYSILNGALELLPQSLASMAIIPLQMKMVYRVGKAHGFELDRGHIKDLLATMGVGLTSQYVEQIGRKLLGGLLGKIGGGLLGRHGQRDDRGRLLVRVHLRAGPRREALLRRRPHDRRRGTAAGVHGDAGRGESSCRAGTRARSPSRRARWM